MASKGFVNAAPGKWGRGQRSEAAMIEGRYMEAETIHWKRFSKVSCCTLVIYCRIMVRAKYWQPFNWALTKFQSIVKNKRLQYLDERLEKICHTSSLSLTLHLPSLPLSSLLSNKDPWEDRPPGYHGYRDWVPLASTHSLTYIHTL